MERRLEQKFARHAREGVTYPNAGARSSLTPEIARFRAKMDRHLAPAPAVAETAAPASQEPAPALAPAATEASPEVKADAKKQEKGSGK